MVISIGCKITYRIITSISIPRKFTTLNILRGMLYGNINF